MRTKLKGELNMLENFLESIIGKDWGIICIIILTLLLYFAPIIYAKRAGLDVRDLI